MQASVKLGLAFAASTLGALAYAEGPVTTGATPARIQSNITQARETPDTSFGAVVHSAGQSVNAASMDTVTEPSSRTVPMGPNVAKTPTPGGPVPIPYPNVTPPADTPVQVKVPTPPPAPAWPSKIDAIGIKQQPVKVAPANRQQPAIIYQTPVIRR